MEGGTMEGVGCGAGVAGKLALFVVTGFLGLFMKSP